MMGYIAPEYLEIERRLKPFICEHGLDEVTVKSLIRGSVEIVESELPTASIAILDADDFEKSASIKFGNIRFNVEFGLKSLFSMKEVCSQEGLWLVLVLIKTMLFFIKEVKKPFGQIEAIVLFCVYRLRNATVEQILAYYTEDNFEKTVTDMELDDKCVLEALDKLMELGTIDMNNGKYFVKEVVIVRNNVL
ncbi:MAG: hypothetical protein NC293_04325 [Roseburia sp.]|nr:hypothetical protein [Roseburia sp.]